MDGPQLSPDPLRCKVNLCVLVPASFWGESLPSVSQKALWSVSSVAEPPPPGLLPLCLLA